MLLRTDFGHLCFDQIGPSDAPVVCLLHSLTSDSGMWAEQVPPLLDAGYSVLRLDMRGHGGSSSSGGEYRMQMLAADVIAVLEHLNIPSVLLVGLSIGGMIGQVVATEYPQRVLALAACATTARWEGNLDMMQGRMAAVRASRTLEVIVDDNMDHRYSPAFRAARSARWSALRETFLGTSLEGYFGCMHAVLNHDVLDRLASVRVPTLVIAGSDDRITPAEQNRLIAEQIPGARYEQIEGGRHFISVEFDDLFNRLLLDWLSGVKR